jgi:hypothetical protein
MSCRMSFVAEYIVKNTPVHTNANRASPRTLTALTGRAYTSRKVVALHKY